MCSPTKTNIHTEFNKSKANNRMMCNLSVDCNPTGCTLQFNDSDANLNLFQIANLSTYLCTGTRGWRGCGWLCSSDERAWRTSARCWSAPVSGASQRTRPCGSCSWTGWRSGWGWSGRSTRRRPPGSRSWSSSRTGTGSGGCSGPGTLLGSPRKSHSRKAVWQKQ